MANATIHISGLDAVQGKVTQLIRAITQNGKLMGQIGSYQSLMVLTRTAMGKDAEGRMFPPYSKYYAAYRQKHGRPTRPVDLFFTGSMTNALTYKVKDDTVRLFFMNTTDKYGIRNPTKAFYNNQSREFFAVGAKDLAAIEKIVRDYITKVTES